MNWYRRLVNRLDPAERLGEVLFGLIMVLGYTLNASLARGAMHTESRALLMAALGCNAAWGIIDAILYVQGELSERGRVHRLVRKVQATHDREAGLAIVQQEMSARLPAFLDPQIRTAVDENVLDGARRQTVPPTRITLDDFLAGLAVFWLVFVTTLPAAIPFVLISDKHLALRVSNGVLILMLFVVGWRWAGYTGASRWGTAGVVTAIALASVGIAAALGG